MKSQSFLFLTVVLVYLQIGQVLDGSPFPGRTSNNSSSVVLELIHILLNSPNKFERQKSINRLAEFGNKAKAAIPALLYALKNDKSIDVRTGIPYALEKIDIQNPKVLLGLKNAFSDPHPFMRGCALASFSRAGESAKFAIPDVIAMLKDDDKGVRWEAILTLGEIGIHASKQVVPELQKCLNDEDRKIRYWAIFALEKLGAEANGTIPELKRIADSDPDLQVRKMAIAVIQRLSELRNQGK